MPFLALQDNKIHCLDFFHRSFRYFVQFQAKKFFFKLFFYDFECFCSQGINNFHNARGHYGEILPRQQPITARDFTGSNLCHIIKLDNPTRRVFHYFNDRCLYLLLWCHSCKNVNVRPERTKSFAQRSFRLQNGKHLKHNINEGVFKH